MPHAQRRGVRLYYELSGNEAAPALLLIRGLARSGRYWHDVRPMLESRFRVIVVDNRGVGRSDAPLPPYSTAAMADDAAAVLDHAGIPRAHVFGISLGGMIAQQIALRHAGRVDRLVLGCTTPGSRRARRAPLLAVLALLRGGMQSFDRALTTTAPYILGEDYLREHPEVLQLWQRMAREEPATLPGLAGQLLAAAMHDVFDKLPGISARTLVVTGDADRLIPVDNSRILAERIPGARLHVLPRAGHDFPTERPAETAALLQEFLLDGA